MYTKLPKCTFIYFYVSMYTQLIFQSRDIISNLGEAKCPIDVATFSDGIEPLCLCAYIPHVHRLVSQTMCQSASVKHVFFNWN